MRATGNNRESSGSEQIHPHNCSMDRAGAARTSGVSSDNSQPSLRTEEPGYFCRGCGDQLPPGFRGHFHTECLRADKRRRVRSRRAQEQLRFKQWLQKVACPRCGAKYGDEAPDHFEESLCEASQSPGVGWNSQR
jgi:hypothetical protein